MLTFTNTVRVDRSPSDVYAYLVNPENSPEWNWAIAEVTKITPGPPAVGSRYRQARTVPAPATETLEIVELDAGSRIEIAATMATASARISYDLTAAEGGTELVNTWRLEPRGVHRLAAPFVGRRVVQQVKSAVASNLRALKSCLETVGSGRSRPTGQSRAAAVPSSRLSDNGRTEGT